MIFYVTKKFNIAKNYTELNYAQGLFVHLTNKRWLDKLPEDLRTEIGYTYADQITELYNGMIHPLTPMSVRGAIWHQGESNAPRAAEYRGVFSALIRDWRAGWGRDAGRGVCYNPALKWDARSHRSTWSASS